MSLGDPSRALLVIGAARRKTAGRGWLCRAGERAGLDGVVKADFRAVDGKVWRFDTCTAKSRLCRVGPVKIDFSA